MPYAEWMAEVEKGTLSYYGKALKHFPVQPFYHWWELELTPFEAVLRIVTDLKPLKVVCA